MLASRTIFKKCLPTNQTTTLSIAKRFKASYLDWPFLTDEHRMIVDITRSFADTQLAPIATELDKQHKFPAEQIKKLGELGMLSVCVDPKWGGSGMDTLSYAIAIEEISRGCASTSVIMSVNNSLYCHPIEMFGTDMQKEQFIKPVTQDGTLGCFMLSEPGNGSDAGAASTTAVDQGEHFLINGNNNINATYVIVLNSNSYSHPIIHIYYTILSFCLYR